MPPGTKPEELWGMKHAKDQQIACGLGTEPSRDKVQYQEDWRDPVLRAIVPGGTAQSYEE